MAWAAYFNDSYNRKRFHLNVGVRADYQKDKAEAATVPGSPILPTSGVTMGVLGMARIPWDKWFRWMLPLQISFVSVAMALLAIAVVIQYQ